MFEGLKLSDFPSRRREVLRVGSSTRPVLWTLEENGVEAVVKDFSGNGTLFRHTIGRFLVWREEKAYRRLRGLNGVPRLYRVIDGVALIMERIPGESLEDLEKRKKLPKSFFDALEAVVADAHARGVAHCDLKRAPNLLLCRDGKPYVVDWSAAVCRTELSLFPFSLIYRRLLLDDLHAITKMQLRHCPEEVGKERLDGYLRRSATEKLVRRVRDRLRELLKKLA